jgi:hypothetical protein
MSIDDTLTNVQTLISELRHVHSCIENGPLPAPVAIILPLMYKRLMARPDLHTLPHEILTVLGSALLRQYPSLHTYYRSAKQQRDADDLHTLIAEALEETS